MAKIIIPLTNYAVGRNGYKPEAVVIHYQQGTQEGTISWFKNPVSEVSAHYAISKLGVIDQFVEETDTAYHGGRVSLPIWSGIKQNFWGGYINPNQYTIGIELEGFRGDKPTELQLKALVELVRVISNRWGFYPKRANIVSHSEIAADKQNTTAICDEVVKQIATPPAPIPTPFTPKQELVALLEKALEISKKL